MLLNHKLLLVDTVPGGGIIYRFHLILAETAAGEIDVDLAAVLRAHLVVIYVGFADELAGIDELLHIALEIVVADH